MCSSDLIMEVHSGLSGLIVENAEVTKDDGIHRFDGIWSSSLTDSTDKGKLGGLCRSHARSLRGLASRRVARSPDGRAFAV